MVVDVAIKGPDSCSQEDHDFHEEPDSYEQGYQASDQDCSDHSLATSFPAGETVDGIGLVTCCRVKRARIAVTAPTMYVW